MQICNLPDIQIYNNSQWSQLRLSECGAKIRWLSDKIQREFPNEKKIGLIFSSSPELILYWLAILDARKEPLILQYPTKKQSYEYWLDSIQHIVETVGLEGILCASEIAHFTLQSPIHTVQCNGEVMDAPSRCEFISDEGAIIQLSSGTTGHRKAIRYKLVDLYRHVLNYNQVLQLTEKDCIVSWLPLYHDMGFIACFVMPLYLNIKVVMMDPMEWINNRPLLYDTLEKLQGTICYMPNFGFEVMARITPERPLPSMRRWISCSEPSHWETLNKFCAVTRTNVDTLCTCYAMAENVFAVSISNGLRTISKCNKQIVSCGVLIPGTAVKLVDGEIYVKSSTSIIGYMNGDPIIDNEGYYPTGDMGFMENGELFVEGRKHDVMIQAGEKILLSEMDYLVNQAIMYCEGRCAAICLHDERIGTQKLAIILEQERVWDKQEWTRVYQLLTKVLPVESFELHFVPTEFITKTSSGKINRNKTTTDFLKFQSWQNQQNVLEQEETIETIIQSYFSNIPHDLPIATILDSMGLLIMDAVASDFNVAISRDMSIAQITELVHSNQMMLNHTTKLGDNKVIKIVSVMDYLVPGMFTSEDINKISNALGAPVTFEHVCMPPAYFMLLDLLFCDYFLCRDMDNRYSDYYECVNKIKEASVLLTDDSAEFIIGAGCQFAVMSRKFQRKRISDYWAVRWQKYSKNHYMLPVGDIVAGTDIPLDTRTAWINALAEYLNIPIFKAAHFKSHAQYTQGWDYFASQEFNHQWTNEERNQLLNALIAFLLKNKDKIKMKSVPQYTGVMSNPIYSDLWHFCAWCVNPVVVEKVIRRFNKFIIHGFPNSIPYLTKRLKEENKVATFLNTLGHNNKIIGVNEAEYDCIIQAGGWGIPNTNLPVIAMMLAGGERTYNLPAGFVLTEDDFTISLSALRRYLLRL